MKMAISARNKLKALVKSPSPSELLDLEVTALFKWQVGHFQPYNVMHVLFAPTTLFSGFPFFPCSPSTVVRSPFRLSEHYSALLTSLQIWPWCPVKRGFGKHIYPIYIEEISQSLATSASLSPANCDVFKKALENDRTYPLISTGHLQLPSPSKALVTPPCSGSSLWCDICSQAERQREKVSLS